MMMTFREKKETEALEAPQKSRGEFMKKESVGCLSAIIILISVMFCLFFLNCIVIGIITWLISLLHVGVSFSFNTIIMLSVIVTLLQILFGRVTIKLV